MRQASRKSPLLIVCILAFFPASLAASGECEDLCVRAGVDLIVKAEWLAVDAVAVALNCVKGCSIP